jgi:PAS domain S-box-containing protein
MNYLTTLFHELPYGIMLCKCLFNDNRVYDSLFLDVNKAYEELIGFSKKDLIHMKASEILPETEPIWFDAFDKVIKSKQNEKYELFHAPTEKYFEAEIIYYKEDQLIVVFKDVTKKTKIHQNLVDANNRFRALSEATFEAIFISDKGICLETNKTATKMFGYSYDELIGIFGTDVIADESKHLVLNNMMVGLEDSYEAIAVKKDGTKFPAEFQGKMFEFQGKTVRVTTVRDLTIRKKNEQELIKKSVELESAKKLVSMSEQLKKSNQELIEAKESLEVSNFKYRQAQNLGKIGHWEYNHLSKKYYWSDEMYNIYNVSKHTYSHSLENYLQLIYKDDLDPFKKTFNKSIRDKRPFEITHRVGMKDGSVRYLKEKCIHQFNEEGEPKLSIGTVQNVSEQVNYENLLKKKTKDRDMFIGVIGHDLANSIGGSIGLIDVLKDDDMDLESKDEVVGVLASSIEKSYTLLTNLIQWGRATQGKVNFNPRMIDCKHLKGKIYSLFESDFENRNINFRFENEDIRAFCADEDMLQAILRNLISNAIKYTPKNGGISLSIKKEGTFTHFCVADTGVGMTQSAINELFNLSDLTSKLGLEGEKGSGFGLQIVQEYVGIHNGRIWIESEPNVGTKVNFSVLSC